MERQDEPVDRESLGEEPAETVEPLGELHTELWVAVLRQQVTCSTQPVLSIDGVDAQCVQLYWVNAAWPLVLHPAMQQSSDPLTILAQDVPELTERVVALEQQLGPAIVILTAVEDLDLTYVMNILLGKLCGPIALYLVGKLKLPPSFQDLTWRKFSGASHPLLARLEAAARVMPSGRFDESDAADTLDALTLFIATQIRELNEKEFTEFLESYQREPGRVRRVCDSFRYLRDAYGPEGATKHPRYEEIQREYDALVNDDRVQSRCDDPVAQTVLLQPLMIMALPECKVAPMRLLLYTGSTGDTAEPVMTLPRHWLTSYMGQYLVLEYKLSEVFGRYVGETEGNVRNFFELVGEIARERTQPLVVVLDNLELFGSRDESTELYARIVTTLLVCLDGVGVQHPNVAYIGICSGVHPKSLDAAVTRPGRFNEWRHVEFT